MDYRRPAGLKISEVFGQKNPGGWKGRASGRYGSQVLSPRAKYGAPSAASNSPKESARLAAVPA